MLTVPSMSPPPNVLSERLGLLLCRARVLGVFCAPVFGQVLFDRQRQCAVSAKVEPGDRSFLPFDGKSSRTRLVIRHGLEALLNWQRQSADGPKASHN